MFIKHKLYLFRIKVKLLRPHLVAILYPNYKQNCQSKKYGALLFDLIHTTKSSRQQRALYCMYMYRTDFLNNFVTSAKGSV